MTGTLTKDGARALVRGILHELAPEVDFDAADEGAPLGDEFDLDSFGFLTLLEMLEARAGVRVPDRDYERISSVAGLVGYLAAPAP